MPIRYDDPRPPYEQLAAELRTAIESGEYRAGDRLPSTRQLAEEYGIAPTTVQHAMRVLREEGLVVAQPGRAAFVQDIKRARRATPDRDDSERDAQVRELEEFADKLAEPMTMEKIVDMLRELGDRLDRLEALGWRPGSASSVQPELEPPEPDPSPGIEL